MALGLNRLRASRDFERVYKQGRKAGSPYVRVFVLSSSQNTSRFGFVVSKKGARKIVDRNRIKRVLREAVRPLLPKIGQSADVVILGNSLVLKLSFTEVKKELLKAFQNAKLIK